MAFRHRIVTATAVISLGYAGLVIAQDAADARTVVATVNGTEITLGHMIVLKERLPAQYQQLPLDVLFDGILDQLVQQTLLGQNGDQLSLGSQLSLENEERALRASEAIQTLSQTAVTDDALQAAYDEMFGNAEPETEYNASHILVGTKEEAEEIIAALQSGADFAKLAQEKSKDTSAAGGGELGWFGKGVMVQPFENGVMALEPGGFSTEPLQTQFGWHVIRLNETRLKDKPSLDQVRVELTDQVRRDAIEARVNELSQGAEITRKSATDIDPALLNDVSLLEN